MYDIIIIGAGPAGLAAAIYASRAMKKTLVLEKNTYGGQIINSSLVENYPAIAKTTGYEFATALFNQVKSLGVEIKNEEVIEVIDNNTIKTNKDIYRTKTIIIANGLKQRKLGLYGENELVGKGISYCATCDGAFFKEKIVAVVGSGETAVEDALYLSNIVKKVYIINRNDKFKCSASMISNLQSRDNVEFIYNNSIIKLNGENRLESIELTDHQILEISGLFVAIGYIPDNKIYEEIVNLDKNGFIESDNTLTKTDNVFVAGDTRTKEFRQLITATSDGATAAFNAINYLNNNWLLFFLVYYKI